MFEKRFLHSPDSYWAFRRVGVWVERPEIWGLLAPFIMLSPKHEEVQDVFRKRRRGRKCDWDALHTLPAAGLHCWLHTDLYLMLKVRNMGWLTCFSILYSLYLGLVHVFFNKNNKRPVFQLEVNQFLAKQAQPNHIFQFTFGLKFTLSCNAWLFKNCSTFWDQTISGCNTYKNSKDP